ncbi:MAG TPA: 1-acyl-sn-glycerol-3-phosphate acyltransferase [Alphaproteobacteria bacterium]
MFDTVAVPVWLVIVAGLLAAWAVLERLLMPSVRWFFRRRVNRLIDEVNARLRIEIPAFGLTKRRVLIDRLMFDPAVQEAAADFAREAGAPRDAVMAEVARYAREIVPAFNAYLYFRVGYWLAKRVATLLYRVRLGFADEDGFRRIDPKSTVVFVMNHRSNMDYVLVAFMAAEKAALSYAVGEWARVWPLQQLIRAMGAYFVRRNSNSPVYRKVLERYVQMATEGGVSQAVYPEGGLSRDGRMRPPRFGLIDYMVKTFDPMGERDLVFIPVGLNYDRVLEDRSLLLEVEPRSETRRKVSGVLTALRFLVRNLVLMARGRWHRFGYACVNFGTPISMRAHVAASGVDFRHLSTEARKDAVEFLVTHLMEAVGRVVPVLPVSLVAAALLRDPDRRFSELELKTAAERLSDALTAAGAHFYVPRRDRDYAFTVGLRMLTLRRLVAVEDGLYSARGGDIPVLSYYANAIDHLLPPEARGAETLRTPPREERRVAR